MKIAIIDGNNLSFKIYSQFKESKGGLLRNSFGVPTTVIFGLLRTLNMLAHKTKFDHVIVCWDTSGSYYRRELFPLYKKHRKYKDMQDYFDELDSARKYLNTFGVNQQTYKGIEADDIIGYLAYSFSKQNHKVVIVSDDKDFYQVVRKNVKIYRPIKDQFINRNEVIGDTGLKPFELPKIKAIMGEDTDFIPGALEYDEKNLKLKKILLGEVAAKKILDGHKTLAEAIDNCSIDKWSSILKKQRKQILMSYKLARIRMKKDQYLDWEKELIENACKNSLEKYKPNIKKVLRVRNDLDLKSINIVSVLKNLGIDLGKTKDKPERISI